MTTGGQIPMEKHYPSLPIAFSSANSLLSKVISDDNGAPKKERIYYPGVNKGETLVKFLYSSEVKTALQRLSERRGMEEKFLDTEVWGKG